MTTLSARHAPALQPGALAALLFACVALSGCLNDFEEERLNRVYVTGIDVAAPEVGTGVVTLVANITIDNRHAESGPLSLVVKAHNTATGLLATTETSEVGRIARDRTETVSVPLRLPKEDGYRITAILFENEERRHQAVVQVAQVDALPVNVVETGLAVRELEFLVENVTTGQVRIGSRVYLTNEGQAESEALRLQVKAREVSTGLLAAEEWADVAPIAVDATRISSVPLQVPDAYNYLVRAVLWQGDFLVGEGEGPVQLLPTFTVPEGEEVVVDRPVVEDFIQRGGSHDSADDEASGEAATPAPGVALVLAILGVLLFLIRRRT